MLALSAGDYGLTLAPERGGSILRFDWRGEPLMRPACGPSILDVACFPLVPFSNRIAHGRFAADGRTVTLSPNFPGSDHPHPLHGFGWLAEWTVATCGPRSATLLHDCVADEWPWPYVASESFALDEDGLTIRLSVTNLGASAMPGGLGFHPYFPRQAQTIYQGLHRGEWRNDGDCLPIALDEKAAPDDWWQGEPIATRAVDTAYTGRVGNLEIAWPERDLALTLAPSDNLTYTVVYMPAGEDHFCVEPVSHMTDAVNRPGEDAGLVMLAPGATAFAGLRLGAKILDST
jgi:aldose 1-epimerase